MREREGGKEGRGVRKKDVGKSERVLEYHEGERGREGGKRGKEERCTSTRVP